MKSLAGWLSADLKLLDIIVFLSRAPSPGLGFWNPLLNLLPEKISNQKQTRTWDIIRYNRKQSSVVLCVDERCINIQVQLNCDWSSNILRPLRDLKVKIKILTSCMKSSLLWFLVRPLCVSWLSSWASPFCSTADFLHLSLEAVFWPRTLSPQRRLHWIKLTPTSTHVSNWFAWSRDQ